MKLYTQAELNRRNICDLIINLLGSIVIMMFLVSFGLFVGQFTIDFQANGNCSQIVKQTTNSVRVVKW